MWPQRELPQLANDYPLTGCCCICLSQEAAGRTRARRFEPLRLGWLLSGMGANKLTEEGWEGSAEGQVQLELERGVISQALLELGEKRVGSRSVLSLLIELHTGRFDRLQECWARAHPGLPVPSTRAQLHERPPEQLVGLLWEWCRPSEQEASRELEGSWAERLVSMMRWVNMVSMKSFALETEECVSWLSPEGARLLAEPRGRESVLNFKLEGGERLLIATGAGEINLSLCQESPLELEGEGPELTLRELSAEKVSQPGEAIQWLRAQGVSGSLHLCASIDAQYEALTWEEDEHPVQGWELKNLGALHASPTLLNPVGAQGYAGCYDPGELSNLRERARALGIEEVEERDEESLLRVIAASALALSAQRDEGLFSLPLTRWQGEGVSELPKCGDALHLESLICQESPNGLVHPGLGGNPERLKPQEEWRVVFRPLNLYATPQLPLEAGAPSSLPSAPAQEERGR